MTVAYVHSHSAKFYSNRPCPSLIGGVAMQVRLRTILVIIALFALGMFAWVSVSRLLANIYSGMAAVYGNRPAPGTTLDFTAGENWDETIARPKAEAQPGKEVRDGPGKVPRKRAPEKAPAPEKGTLL
jgi:hypothetical protein